MFPSSAFSAVSSNPDDSRVLTSSSAITSPLMDRSRVGHRLIPDQPPSTIGQYPHLANPVPYPPW